MSVRKLIETNPFIGDLHDTLLDLHRHSDGSPDYVAAFDDSCAWIAELAAQTRLLEKAHSKGFLRENTSHLKWQPDPVPHPVEDDSWISTGREV